ncbi:MAG: EAL domain-containing protein [bacterium]|nr:EAL domain-containing protein [bacterium]
MSAKTTKADLVKRIKRLEKIEKNLKRENRQYVLAAKSSKDGLWFWDLGADRIFYSARFKSMLGFKDNEMTDRPEEWFKRVHLEDLPRLEMEIASHLNGGSKELAVEFRMLHKDGTQRWFDCRGMAARSGRKKPDSIAGSLTDITIRKKEYEQLNLQTFYDYLTGLPNRAYFLEQLKQAFKNVHRNRDSMFAVMYLDLDRFKIFNEGLGHSSGDELLKIISHVLESALRPKDIIARVGGDEFTILLNDIWDTKDAELVARRIQSKLSKPLKVGGQEVFISTSIGIATSDLDFAMPDDLVRYADVAMRQAKALGGGRYTLFDRTMHVNTKGTLRLETDLRRAIERKEFKNFYQPIIQLDTGEVVGFEALIRWFHPDRGLVPPGDFIPLAEQTGLIIDIGQWVLSEACRQLRIWKKRYVNGKDCMVSVNLSGKQFSQSDMVEAFQKIITREKVDPKYVWLEITETAIMQNPATAASMLARIKKMKIQLCIDDFGTGYSSLGTLHNFPIDKLKIDRPFINRLGSDEESLEIVRTIIALANHLKLDVVAEGIETREQMAILQDLKCMYAQGFLFARPMEASKAAGLLGKNIFKRMMKAAG